MEENNANTIDAQAQAAQQDQIPPIPEAVPAAPSVSPDPAQAASTPAHQTTSGLAIAGLVLGILAILGAFVPLLNILTAPFAIVGLILAIIGLMGINKGKHSGKGIAVAGVVLGAVALVVTLGMYGCAGAVASSSGSSSSSTASSSTAATASTAEASSATSSAVQNADYIGAWDITKLTMQGKTYNEAQLKALHDSGLDFFLNIEDDGTWLLCMGNEDNTLEGTWAEAGGGNLTLTAGTADPETFRITGDTASLGDIPFKKAGASKKPPVAQKDEQQSSASESSSTASADSGEVSPDVKEALDSYEAVMDDYVAFMKKYKDSGYSASMLSDYTDMMQKYTEFSEKINAMDTNSMSNADYAYYIEVTSRVSQKLLEAM